MTFIRWQHNKHKCLDVNEVADELREHMIGDVSKINAGVETTGVSRYQKGKTRKVKPICSNPSKRW